MSLKFVSRPAENVRDEHIVEAVDPAAGNDAALLAVFNNAASAAELASLLNFVAGLQAQCKTCNKELYPPV